MEKLHDIINECLAQVQSKSEANQKKALQTLDTVTKFNPQNRNFLAQINGAISALFTISNSSSSTNQILALSTLFNLSLNPNLKHPLATMDNILCLNSIILSPVSAESSKLAASLLCSLAMLDKNKAKFGVTGSIHALIKAISGRASGQAAHHLLSSLAEMVQFHGNCSLAVRAGAVPVLLQVVQNSDAEDSSGTALAILCLLSRFEEGLIGLIQIDNIVCLMLEVLKGRRMFSKEGAAAILDSLFDGSEKCLRDGLMQPDFLSVVADLSIRGSGRAREKASLLMRKLMEAAANSDSYGKKF